MACKLNNKEAAELRCLRNKLKKDKKLSPEAAARLRELERLARGNGEES